KNESCSSAACDVGLTCVDNRCVDEGDVGAPCDDQSVSVLLMCKPTLSCINNRCQPSLAAGAACTAFFHCSLAGGLDCLGDPTGSGPSTCQPVVFAAPGESCSTNTSSVRCRASWCSGEELGSRCIPYLAEGAA